MTVIKQKGVASKAHLMALSKYLDDERALMRGTQNLSSFGNWRRDCESTRRAYGHDEPGKAGAKTTYMYHQVIAFLPEESSCSSKRGKMTPEACMAFAREWLEATTRNTRRRSASTRRDARPTANPATLSTSH